MNTEKLCHLAGLAPQTDEINGLECALEKLINASKRLTEANLPSVSPCEDTLFCPLREDIPDENAAPSLSGGTETSCKGGVFAVKRIIL